jgi:hypothetical protein
LNLFVFFFSYLALTFETSSGDGDGKIFGARCGSVWSVSVRNDRVVSGGAFVVISTAVISDCGVFFLGLLRLGFGSLTLMTFSTFAVW